MSQRKFSESNHCPTFCIYANFRVFWRGEIMYSTSKIITLYYYYYIIKTIWPKICGHLTTFI